MTPEELVEAITANLLAERDAVVTLDATRVTELGEEKDRLVALLASSSVPRELAPRLTDLVAMARYNCQLIAHARDALKGTAAIVAGAMRPVATSSDDLPRRGVRVSVTG